MQRARELLTLEEKDPRRLFEGAALLRRMKRMGLLSEDEAKLDFVLQLTTQKLLERRLQTKVFKQGLAKSIHHARVLIYQRHIRCAAVAGCSRAAGCAHVARVLRANHSVGRQLVNVPSFMVRTDSEKHIDFALTSPFGAGRPVRRLRPLPRQSFPPALTRTLRHRRAALLAATRSARVPRGTTSKCCFTVFTERACANECPVEAAAGSASLRFTQTHASCQQQRRIAKQLGKEK